MAEITLDKEESTLDLFSMICCSCLNFDKEHWDNKTGRCKAFPDGVPIEIWQGRNNHKKPYKGDNGIRYELNSLYK